jgi:hypothetical protein
VILYTVLYPNFSHAEADIDAALVAIGESLKAVKKLGLLS